MGKTRDDTLHLRLDSDFKAQIEAAAARLDIPVAAYARMAIREYLQAREGSTIRESAATGYTAPKKRPGAGPDKTARNAAVTARTSYFVVTRKG